MLKHKFKLIIILLIAILLLSMPVVRAENETDAENGIMPINNENEEDKQEQEVTTSSDNNYEQKDMYLIDDNITIDYAIDGNLFVLANNVTINSQVGGDIFICSNSLNIEKTSYVYGNIFAISSDITIDGIVCDLYSISNNLTVNGTIIRDIRVSSNNVNFSGNIGRNAYVSCSALNFVQNADSSSDANIAGDLYYSSTQEASIPEDCVSGNVSFNQKVVESPNIVSTYLNSLARFVVIIIAVWLLCLWLAPKFLKNTSSLLTTKKILPIAGLGILTPIVLILVSILLLFLGVTSTIGLLLFMILCILLAISTAIFVISISNLICDKLKITKTFYSLGILIVSSICLSLVGFIPYVGSIVEFIAIIMGMLYNRNSKVK